MHRKQKFFLWAWFAWVGLTIGTIVGMTPWLEGVVAVWLIDLGAVLLVVGVVLACWDVWRSAVDRGVRSRLLITAALGLASLGYLAWMLVLRLPRLTGQPDSLDTLLDWPIISETVEGFANTTRYYVDWLPCAIEEGVFPVHVALILGGLGLALVLAGALAVYLALRRLWRQRYDPQVALRRWAAILVGCLVSLWALDGSGLELVRRCSAVAWVVWLHDGLSVTDYGPPPEVVYVQYEWSSAGSYSERTLAPGEYAPPPEGIEPVENLQEKRENCHPSLGAGRACYIPEYTWEVNPDTPTFMLERAFGSQQLCRLLPPGTPPTRWHCVDEKMRTVRVIERVTMHCGGVPRHIWGDWYEYRNNSIEFPLAYDSRSFSWSP